MGSKSAQKAARTAGRRQLGNKAIRSQVKTDITRAEKLIFSGDIEAAGKAVTAAVSALDKAANKVKAFKVGGVDYIIKPFQWEELLKFIKKYLLLYGSEK